MDRVADLARHGAERRRAAFHQFVLKEEQKMLDETASMYAARRMPVADAAPVKDKRL